jgi:hypothetical protein
MDHKEPGMTLLDLTLKADSEGRVHLDLPTGSPHARVRLHVELEVADRRRAKTREEYLAFIESVHGKGNDPTFEPPPDAPMDGVEAL